MKGDLMDKNIKKDVEIPKLIWKVYGKEYMECTMHGGWRTELINKLIEKKKEKS